MNVGKRNRVAIRGECGHHRGVTQSVDEPRYPAGIAEDLRVSLFGEYLPVSTACNFQPVLDVSAHLRCRQRGEMESQAYALRKLNQLGRIEFLVELGLSRQDDPQHLLFGGLNAREQANL